MKTFLLAWFLLLFFPSGAWAKTCEVAYYAIQSPYWDCNASIEELAPCHDIKISVLMHTFGDDLSCLRRILSDKRVSAAEFHLINERCGERPGGCGPYEFMYGISNSHWATSLARRDPPMMHRVGVFFTQLAGQIIPLLQPHTVCWVSPVLESNLNSVSFQPLAEIAHWQFFQRCHVVDNPLKHRSSPFIIELHGNRPRINPPCIADLDGMDIKLRMSSDAATRKRAFYSSIVSEQGARQYFAEYRKCGAAFAWVHEFNCREARFADPRNRRVCAGREVFRRVVSLFP